MVLSAGKATDDELKFFVQQFSVFSNQFLVAALLRVINAGNLEQQHASKQILLNELHHGVIYRKPDAAAGTGSNLSEGDKDREGRPGPREHRRHSRRRWRSLPLPSRPL